MKVSWPVVNVCESTSLRATAESLHLAMDAEGHPCLEDEFLWRISRDGSSSRWPLGAGSGLLDAAAQQIEDYIAGRQVVFDLPLAYTGTPFQVEVWQALTRIPYGETRSYGDIAEMIDRPAAMRLWDRRMAEIICLWSFPVTA